MKTKLRIAGIVIALVVSCAYYNVGCGGGSGGTSPVVSGLITGAGGTVTSGDGKLVLTFPAGALSTPTTITITTVSNAGVVQYDLSPTGLTFLVPITAVVTTDIADAGALVDENGDPLNVLTRLASMFFFLRSAPGEFEAVDNVSIVKDADTSVVTATMSLEHFTSLLSVTGNSYYVYLTSIGTHYVGSGFKADLDIRYLGYSATSSYLNMSIEYTVRSITVNKITITPSGVISLNSPAEINRSDTLSTRGQTSSTRPRFICDEVGNGTVVAKVDVSATVEVTFQPENVNRAFTVNQSESTTRKGKCIARIAGAFSNRTGTEVALTDPVDDFQEDEGGVLTPSGVSSDLPGYADATQVGLGVVNGEALEASFIVDGTVPTSTPAGIPQLGFIVAVLDSTLGATDGSALLNDVSSYFGVEAASADTALASGFYQWDGSAFQMNDDVDVDFFLDGDLVSFLIQLESLGVSAEEVVAMTFRAATRLQTDLYPGVSFVDVVDVAF